MSSKQGGKAKPLKQPKADKKEYDEVTLLNPNFICELRTKTLFVWLPHVSAVSGRLMRTTVVRFVDAAADAAAYYIATAGFTGVSRRTRQTQELRQRNEQELTQNVDAAAAACTLGNQTNSPKHDMANLQKKKDEEKALKELRAKASQKGSFGGSGLKKSGKK
uniref:Uncharacterized protein n=1 Tax=Brassica campestris TaxID=3711 RepID=M4DJI9_BRACM